MSYRRVWEVVPGVILIALGLLFLLDTLGVLSAGRVLATYWPLLVIAAGLILLWGAGRWRRFTSLLRGPVGDVRIGETDWDLKDMETSIGIGELRLDLGRARVSLGETSLRVKGGVGKIEILAPLSLPLSAHARVGMGSINLLGHKTEGIGRELSTTSSDYATAERKVKVYVNLGIGETSIVRRQ